MGPSGWREGCGPSGIGQDDTTQSSPSDRRGNQGTDPRHSSNPNSGFLGNRVPESPFPSPPVLPWVSNTWSYVGSGGALWACFPNWKVCPCCQRGSSSNFFLPGVPPTYPSRPGKISAEESHSLSEKKAQPRDARCTKDPFLSTPYFQPSPPGICP